MHLPVMHFSFALWSVTFPFSSKVQADVPRLGRAFLDTVSVTAIGTLPVFLAMATVPDIVIGGLFGEQWKPALRAFQILCLCGPFMAMMRVFGAVSHAKGYVFSECGRQVIYLITAVLALWIALPYGLEGVALAVAVSVIGRYWLLAHLCLDLTEVTWKQFLAAQMPGVLLAIPVILFVYVASMLGFMFTQSHVLLLALVIAVPLLA